MDEYTTCIQLGTIYTHYSISPLPCSPTHLLLLSYPGISIHWVIEPSQEQGPLLPLMSNKAILCYIYSWSHESHHVCSLVGGLVPESSKGSGWLILLFFLWVANPFSSFSPFFNSSIGDIMHNTMVSC